MGFFGDLFGLNQIKPPQVSILPVAAKNEIMAGRLPILNTDKVFLKRGEKIHYIEKGVSLEIKIKKMYRHVGHSGPGLFKGNRYNVGVGTPIESKETVPHKGILYVTNQRVIFQTEGNQGFDKTYKYLTTIEPYSDACQFQFGSKTYNILVPDGNCLYQVLQLIKQRRQYP